MRLLESVYSEHEATVGGSAKVSYAVPSQYIAAVRQGIPDLLHGLLEQGGRAKSDYRIYGSVGQVNFNWAKIPWVAVCKRSVTTSTEKGHYLVLLFRQDMAGCYLSLNQGYTQFRDAYGLDSLAQKQIQRSAAASAEYIDAPFPFISGPIDLGASHAMGKGYERGAIVSRFYPRTPSADAALFAAEFQTLLGFYDRLTERVGGTVLNLLPPIGEDDFQEAASALANEPNVPPPQAGPIPPPPALTGGRMGRYKRDIRVAARALRTAGFSCEADPTHFSFTAKRNGKNFVEAHHLFPMSRQPGFPVSLDVPENIMALCPTCHRLLHHGIVAEKRPLLTGFYRQRSTGLKGRGIAASLQDLIACYSGSLDDDD